MELLTRKEVAKYFRVSERTIDRWIVTGSLKGYKFGTGKRSTLRIPKNELDKFLKKSRIKSKHE